MPNWLQHFNFNEMIVFLQMIIGAIGLWIAWRNHKMAREDHEQKPSFSSSGPSYPLTRSLCTNLFVVDQLGAVAETGAAVATYASSVQNSSAQNSSAQISSIASRGYVDEDQELNFLVQVLQQYYLYAYNLYWTSTVSASNPFTNNQCLRLLQNETDQIQYEKLSQDLEAYAALSVKAQKPTDVVYALVLTYFITRVRIIQVQNATLDLSAAAVYAPTSDLITFGAAFVSIVSPQLGPKTRALVSGGSCTPALLASTLLQTGEHNAMFTGISTGQKAYTFVCGSPM